MRVVYLQVSIALCIICTTPSPSLHTSTSGMQHMTNRCRLTTKSLQLRLVSAAKHLAMATGAYVNKPDRRIRHLHDILTCGPRTFDTVVVGAGTLRLRYSVLSQEGRSKLWFYRCCWASNMQGPGPGRSTRHSARGRKSSWNPHELEKQRSHTLRCTHCQVSPCQLAPMVEATLPAPTTQKAQAKAFDLLL